LKQSQQSQLQTAQSYHGVVWHRILRSEKALLLEASKERPGTSHMTPLSTAAVRLLP
jgi:hypothetical protein